MAMLPPERRWKWPYAMADEMMARGRVESGKTYRVIVRDLAWLRESGVLDKLFVALALREVPHSFDGDRRIEAAGNVYVIGERVKQKPEADNKPLGYVVDEKVDMAAVRRFHADH
ncbi:hypothetical protein LF599_07400 [Pseudodesulfovibrio thermohalotolerans]|uniref:hypothetical protein n=1 Tax=Pseudodesulfovibrio thermohalotolerans TaxID=2880651 RepID=UPI0024428C81|nr:hypothetical protein [Pseudodesulfovibrio thermohalotolerans]WFS63980.1 hypothetical protein LF599_07400 [Pseudodesulfovibrio thermohalotolerans]